MPAEKGIDYLQVEMVADQIRTLVSQPYYHLNNVMIYYRNHAFLLNVTASLTMTACSSIIT